MSRTGAIAALSGTNYKRGEEGLKKYLRYEPQDNEPDLANANYHLGQIYEAEDKTTEASESYRLR
jgi:TolA-binding protein